MDVVLAAGDAPWEAAALGEIEASPGLRLVRRCVDVADLLAVAHTGLAEAAIVTTDLPGLDADAVHHLEVGGVRVAALESDPARCEALGITRTLRLGGLDVIVRDGPIAPATRAEDRAPVVAVWGPAGAPGRSTVALSIAAATAARGVDTVLVDADTYGGSLGQALSVLDDVSGLVAACRAANNGRSHEVAGHLLDIDPRLRLLTGLPRADMWPQVRTGALELLLAQLRAQAALVVVDCGFSVEPGTGHGAARNQTTLQVLEQADHVVVVGLPDPVGLARVVRGIHDLAEVAPGIDPTLVVNRMRGTLGWSEREVRTTVGRLTGMEPLAYLPLDQAGLDLAMVSGRSPRQAAPSSPFVARMEVVAAHVLARLSPEAVLASVAP
jgi:Flp pilus assembly CpaE family ATPase